MIEAIESINSMIEAIESINSMIEAIEVIDLIDLIEYARDWRRG